MDRYTFKLRRDTPTRWAEENPVLADGEPGYEKGTHRMKIGDGYHAWLDLPYLSLSGTVEESNSTLPLHVNSEDPHPVYDDGRSFYLLYENAKV